MAHDYTGYPDRTSRTVVDGDETLTLVQVGWVGKSKRIYTMDDLPIASEPGGFAPIWVIAEEAASEHHTMAVHQNNLTGWSTGGNGYYPHDFFLCGFSGAGNCCCGRPEGSNVHNKTLEQR